VVNASSTPPVLGTPEPHVIGTYDLPRNLDVTSSALTYPTKGPDAPVTMAQPALAPTQAPSPALTELLKTLIAAIEAQVKATEKPAAKKNAKSKGKDRSKKSSKGSKKKNDKDKKASAQPAPAAKSGLTAAETKRALELLKQLPGVSTAKPAAKAATLRADDEKRALDLLNGIATPAMAVAPPALGLMGTSATSKAASDEKRALELLNSLPATSHLAYSQPVELRGSLLTPPTSLSINDARGLEALLNPLPATASSTLFLQPAADDES
jgi:hypothetical protein